MAAMVASIAAKMAEVTEPKTWKAAVLGELPGLALGFLTLAWIVSSLHGL